MKKTSKLLSVFLACVLLLSALPALTLASQVKTVSFCNYNVSGLPDFKAFIGKGEKDVKQNQLDIGGILTSKNYDVIAVQEDFGYHSSLKKTLAGFDYETQHTGGVPGGDGMNIYSKYPLYNETRIKWEKAYGVIANGADEMTPKGILYCVLDLGDGVLVDFYDIHADAYGDSGSREARRDNFRQLSELINSKGADRPVIATGDFNTYFYDNEYDDGLSEYFLEGCGMKEAWVELYNNGDYKDFSSFRATGVEEWGNWNSVEKFFYRDGGGVKVVPESFAYEFFKNGSGKTLSDHASASATFSFEKTDDFKQSDIKLSVTKRNELNDFIKKMFVLITDFFKALAHIDELKGEI